MYNVIRNNDVHNEARYNGYGDRNIYLSGYSNNSGRNLIEGNRIGHSGLPPDNWGSSGMSLLTGYNIVRLNSFFYNNNNAITMSLTSSYLSDIVYNKIYHNSFLHHGYNTSQGTTDLRSTILFALYSGSHIIKYNAAKNNLFFDDYKVVGSYNVNLNDQILSGNWNGDTQGDPRFVDASTVPTDPMNPSLPDMRLEPTSPAIDAGTYLTRVSSPSGSGTTFQLEDAGYFMDGWGIVQGDTIQLMGTSQRAVIKAINYQTNMITVDTTLNWTQYQGVGLSYQGTAPDVGAYEHAPSV
jgi:hypothetical protein